MGIIHDEKLRRIRVCFALEEEKKQERLWKGEMRKTRKEEQGVLP